MSILGVESIVFGVKEMDAATAFLDAFGLDARDDTDGCVRYRLEEGSSIVLMPEGDPRLPAPSWDNDGPREIVWGVDTAEALAAIRAALSDQEVRVDADGSLHTRDPAGVAIGFRLFSRKAPGFEASQENASDQVARWNATRRWYQRARPRVIHHVVFMMQDIDAAVDFYVGRLGFKITDISRAFGVFVRADGRHDHHNMFLVQGASTKFHHISFGVENIDELMVGANHMQRRGWRSAFGLGRHRISSGVFFFMPSPFGGEFEYFADSDYADDGWTPRLWEPGFGAFQWAAELPGPVKTPPQWVEPVPLPDPIPSFSSLSQAEAEYVFLTESGESEAADVRRG